MRSNPIFRVLYLLARPAAGKSEIIQFLQTVPEKERIESFHIGRIKVIDDFPMIWTWFEEDDLLTEMGCPHLYTDDDGYFLKQYFWNLLIRRLNLEYAKFIRDHHNHKDYTVIIEFSRGKEHGGYQEAFTQIPETLANKAAILYVNVSWEESLRKNRKRFNPDKPDSILEHSLPDEKLTRMYRETDWEELVRPNIKHVEINSVMVPFAIMDNEDDVTSGNIRVLSSRLRSSLERLWSIYSSSQSS